jgi:hypothetical protein
VKYVWNGDKNIIHTGLEHLLAVRHFGIFHCMCRCLIIQLKEINLFKIFLICLFKLNFYS